MSELLSGATEHDSMAFLNRMDWDFVVSSGPKLSHGIHPYPAKYVPEIPRFLIAELSSPGDTVGDIFCGSGTTLVEASIAGRRAVGVDANPLACLISRAKTNILSNDDVLVLEELFARALDLAFSLNRDYGSGREFKSSAWRPEEEDLLFWFEDFVIEEMAEILSWCRDLDGSARDLALVAFSAIVVNVSKQDSDTRYVRRIKNTAPGDVSKKFSKSLERAVEALKEFKQSAASSSVQVFHENILEAPLLPTMSLVVTSPPYPNAYSYHLYHRTRMQWLEMDQPTFKKVEIGSHRKYSAKGMKTANAKTFRDEMTIVFDCVARSLTPNGFVCMVVGDSTLKGERIDNASLLSDAASAAGFIERARIDRKLLATRKAFNPAIGKITSEKILILQVSS